MSVATCSLYFQSAALSLFFGLVVEVVPSAEDGICGDLWMVDADHPE